MGASLAVALGASSLVGLGALGAQAAPGDAASLSLTLSQVDGTDPWSSDDSAGNDSAPDNGIIRTNDTVTYNLGIRYEGEDQTKPVVSFELPRGQELVQLPPYCLSPGSSVTPASLPAPASPLTATSWQTLPRQKVTCTLKNETMSTALNYAFVARVRSEVPQGTVMDQITFSAVSDQVPTAASITASPLTVSAAARYDLSKRVDSTDVTKGPLFQYTGPCPAPYGSEACRTVSYPISLTTPSGGKGITPLSGPITFTDNLSPANFYGATVWARMVAAAGSEAAATTKYGPMLRSCGKVGQASGFRTTLPYSSRSMAESTPANAATETGTLSCPATARGVSGTITLTGTDTTGYRTPTTSGSGNALASNLGFVATGELSVSFPEAALLEFGSEQNDGTYTLETYNEYTDVKMTSLTGASAQDSDPSNNDREATVRVETGGSVNKGFTGIPGVGDNTDPATFNTGDPQMLPGPPGSGVFKDGNTVVMPGQAIYSNVLTSSSGGAGSGTAFSRTLVTCDTWDSTRLALASHPDWNGGAVAGASYPGNNRPVFPSLVRHPYYNLSSSTIGSATSGVRSYKVEYSSGPSGGAGTASTCASGTWSENPDDIVAPVADTQGRKVWEGITRVRITWTSQFPAGTTFSTTVLNFVIGQVVLDSTSKAPIGNWVSQEDAKGVKTPAEVFADAARVKRYPTYDPVTHRGTLGDRLWQGDARVRVRKYVENRTTGEFTDTTVPQYSSGSNIRYRLDPSLTGDVTVDGIKRQVTLEDCLPRYQVFIDSQQGGTGLTPQVVQMGAPAGAEITCADNRQYVKWDLGELPVGKPIEPIVVNAEILEIARNGTYTNTVVAASPADISALALRQDEVQVQLVVPTGLKISKTVDRSVIEVNPTGVTKPRTLTWSVLFANIDAPQNVANVDVIDVLPDNSVAGNDFTGTLDFTEATVKAGGSMTLLYSKTPHTSVALDPRDPTNAAAGSTVWCDAASLTGAGTVVSGSGTAADCPTGPADVTALRIQRPGPFATDDDFQVDIKMTPVGNHSADVYVNRTSGKADGVTQSVGPARRRVEVVASTIGDFVWEDANKNGRQDTGEPGIPGWPVRLVGTDVDGNAVKLSTVTDATGHYSFSELASGDYQVIFDPAHLAVDSTFTTQQVDGGDHPGDDSDADPASGETPQFKLGVDSADNSWDAGVFIDRNVDIAVAKKFVSRTDLDADNKTTVVYDVTVSNGGTAQGTYDLDDRLKFGTGVTITQASVANTTPGTITTDPAFDGQSNPAVVRGQVLKGGESHVYRVSVDATITTKLTKSSGDCTLDSGESGTGFLNSATVTSDGLVSEAIACDPVPPAKTPSVTLDKALISTSALDPQHRSTSIYRITVSNTGDGKGEYDLSDELQYAPTVTVDSVAATNVKPGTIPVNPSFDGVTDLAVATGVTIEPGATHEFHVTVTGTVTATTTESANVQDCTLSSTESGTGYLNEARLTVNGVTTKDTACEPVTPPGKDTPKDPQDPEEPKPGHPGKPTPEAQPPGPLPDTGGPTTWLLLGVAASLLAGAALVLGRRKEEDADVSS